MHGFIKVGTPDRLNVLAGMAVAKMDTGVMLGSFGLAETSPASMFRLFGPVQGQENSLQSITLGTRKK
jgi:hypothetical protein